jgi:hypothetical protein
LTKGLKFAGKARAYQKWKNFGYCQFLVSPAKFRLGSYFQDYR